MSAVLAFQCFIHVFSWQKQKKKTPFCERNSEGRAPKRSEVTSHVISWCKVEGKARPRGTGDGTYPWLFHKWSGFFLPPRWPCSPCTVHGWCVPAGLVLDPPLALCFPAGLIWWTSFCGSQGRWEDSENSVEIESMPSKELPRKKKIHSGEKSPLLLLCGSPVLGRWQAVGP